MTPRAYDMALGTLIEAIPGIAERKNIPLAPEQYPVVARLALADYHPRDIRDLNRLRPDSVAFAANALHRALDVFFVAQVIRQKLTLAGREVPDMEQVLAAARGAIDGFVGNDADPTAFRWPDPARVIAGQPVPRSLSVALGESVASPVVSFAASANSAGGIPQGDAP